jgi:sugar phosphate isomerase/epimerase
MLESIWTGHWLGGCWAVKNVKTLADAVKNAHLAGARAFELIYHILNGLTAKETAQALKIGGIQHAAMCVFFPGEEGKPAPMGDPLSKNDAEYQAAVDTFRQVCRFIVDLQWEGIKIDLIVGPSCLVLARNYGVDRAELHKRIVRFYRDVITYIKLAQSRVAIEMLRAEEDCVIEDPSNLFNIITMLNNFLGCGIFGAHIDTFHCTERGINPTSVIRQLRQHTFHLHLNGSKRRPAGSEGDTVNWQEFVTTCKAVGLNDRMAGYEPFSQTVRDNCPPLGVGLPPAVEEPAGMIFAKQTLEAAGMNFVA